MTVIRRDDYEPATEHERVRRRIQAALKGEEYSIAEMAADLERLTDQLAGAVSECERLRSGLRAALDYLQLNDSIDYNTALTRVRAALEDQ